MRTNSVTHARTRLLILTAAKETCELLTSLYLRLSLGKINLFQKTDFVGILVVFCFTPCVSTHRRIFYQLHRLILFHPGHCWCQCVCVSSAWLLSSNLPPQTSVWKKKGGIQTIRVLLSRLGLPQIVLISFLEHCPGLILATSKCLPGDFLGKCSGNCPCHSVSLANTICLCPGWLPGILPWLPIVSCLSSVRLSELSFSDIV